MPLRTVKIPAEFESYFGDAEALVSRYFAQTAHRPERGTLEISGERYVLVRAASMSVEFFTLVRDLFGAGREDEASEFARNILFDLAHSIGGSDERTLHVRMGVDEPIARLSAGPVHFAHTGWAFVEILPDSRPVPSDDFVLVYDHPYSFEADAWVRAGRRPDSPACVMSAGYSSGWCGSSFGISLVASEVTCRALGDERCRFVMAPAHRIEQHIARLRTSSTARPSGRGAVGIPDLFSRKRIEDELRRARDDLEKRVEVRTGELREANERLRDEMVERARAEQQLRQTQKLEAIGRLAGGVAHDFNTLLAVILGNAGLLSRKLGDAEELRGFVDAIVDASERAAGLIRQLLAFSRAQPRGEEVLDINPVVEQLTKMLSRVVGEDVELIVKLGTDVRGVQLDRVYVEQIVMNLVVNARDAMPSGGRLAIETSRVAVDSALAMELGGVQPGDYVVLAVSDEGEGMSDDVVARMFEPYFSTKTSASGTGLGLSTVYGIVKNAGGGIVVRTEPGRGSSFRVHLPSQGTPSSLPRPSQPERAARASGQRVLVVEDQAELRRTIVEILREGGYVVYEAASADDALALAAGLRVPIDLLLTDVVMPRMSGPQLALRLLGERPSLRVVYMSGYAADDSGVQKGAVKAPASLLSKPFSVDALLAKLREAFEEPA